MLRLRGFLAGTLLGLTACGAEHRGPTLVLLPFEVVAGTGGAAGESESLRVALGCRLDERGITTRLVDPATAGADSAPPPEAIGRRIGAAWVLGGSVVASRESLRIVVHLTEVADDRGAWVKSFRGTWTERGALTAEMSQAVSERLPPVAGMGSTAPAICDSTDDIAPTN